MFRGNRPCVWCLYFVSFLISLDLAIRLVEGYGNPASEFSTHSIVRPRLRHARSKRDITTTKHSTGLHRTEVTLTVSVDGEEHELELRLNEELVPSGHTLSYQQDGETKVHTPGKEELDICQYSGRVRGKPGAWAAVSTCRGVRGVIYDGRQMRYIQPVQDDGVNGDHFLYSHENLSKTHRCGNEGSTYNSSSDSKYQQQRDELAKVNRHKRHISEDALVREPYNANSDTRYVELVLVTDSREFRASGSDWRRVHHHMKDLANIINSVYSPLNIFIALVGVEVWSDYDKIAISEKSEVTLDNFARYRETELVTRIPNDNAHLLTQQKFLDSVVGKALMGVMCSYKASAGIASNHSPVVGLVAMTIAHEMGHNFGMDHDRKEPDCKCPGEKCIMSPVSSMVTPLHWSSCSLKSLSLSFERGLDYCLRNKPKRLFRSSTCGNGFLEEGEECDCGTAPGEVTSRDSDRGACQQCCKPDCTLRANATCGHGQCCDLTRCHYKPAATECRSAQRECDLPEFCTGDSQFCPQDWHKMDTTPCGNKEAYCVRGSCQSHEDQCRLLWGVTGYNADDVCYRENVRGDFHGNCGYDHSGLLQRCAPQDVKCGTLQCRHYNDRLEYGLESATVGSSYPMYNGKMCAGREFHSFAVLIRKVDAKRFVRISGISTTCGTLQCRHYNERLEYGLKSATVGSSYPMYNGKLINPCRTAVTGLGARGADPGLAPDGARCGPHEMCMNQKCESVDRVRAKMAREGTVCPSNCSGHGVCNSNGNCHCEPGFAPPLCEQPGPGGSYDSGPATDPSGLKIFMIVMYAVFLGIIPVIVLLLLLIYNFCPGALSWWKKQKLFQRTNNINGFRSKFTMPNFTTFGTSLGKNNTNKGIHDFKSTNLSVPTKLVIDDTPACTDILTVKSTSVVEVNVSNANRPMANVAATVLVSSTNKKNVKQPVRLNRKINKEDIVIVENYCNPPAIHNTGYINFNVETKPKVNVTKNKFESSNSAQKCINPPIENAVNRPKIEVVKNNFESLTSGEKSTSSSLIMPKPNVSSDPYTNSKPSIKLKPSHKPKLSIGDENKRNLETRNTNTIPNELLNQRSKLRKVTGRDITK